MLDTEAESMPSDDPRRAALAEFLRQRRARLTPADAGLPPGRRRRTPGLRREEVAELAGVGTDWYTWLEQGREINVSVQVLDGIATALRLTPEERRHLFVLSRREEDTPAPPECTLHVSPALQWILDEHRLNPALVTGPRTELLAWNRAATVVFGDFDALPAAERTWLRLTFTDTPVRRGWVHWERAARDLLATYRAASARHVGDPSFAQDVTELMQASIDFRRWWPRHDVSGPYKGPCEFIHPVVDQLLFEATTFSVHGNPDQSLSVYATEPGSETAEKLARLLEEPSGAQRTPAPVGGEASPDRRR